MEAPTLKEQGYLPCRYVVAFMAFLGMVCNYMLRVNINLAIVAMVKPSESNITNGAQDVCGFGNSSDTSSDSYAGEFPWNEWEQSLATGAFFWGYIWTQIPGGRLAEIVGARKVFGSALLGASVMTFLVPLAAHWDLKALVATRVMLGFTEGATFPSTHALLANWAPPLERSMLATIIYAGSQAGTVLTFPLTAALIEWRGWESVFYVQAAITLVWCLAWFLVVSDGPTTSKKITQAERDYILNSVGDSKDLKPPPVPVKKVLSSPPVWAILVAGVGNNWGFYTLLTDLPLYMKNMLQMDIKSNAILSGFPYLGMWIFSVVVGTVGDKLRQKGVITTGTLRKVAIVIAHMGPAVCLCCLALVECDRGATIALLFFAVTLQGAQYSGHSVNHIDIAPNFAGTLFGFTNSAATIPGWVAPMTVGLLTNNQQTFEQWRKVFYIAAVIFFVDASVFVMYSSGTEQSWNRIKEEKSKKTLKSKAKGNVVQSSLPWQQPFSSHRDSTSSLAYNAYVINVNNQQSYYNSAFTNNQVSPNKF
ncbi:putative inorganic phosphate cotransporter [Oratosquilla oratoria]|uniref:putative inorganic phosphate cotransporter n=1 Tax=Oratosquilla oratoria TaxID=337810 RepID=UPI003F76C75A